MIVANTPARLAQIDSIKEKPPGAALTRAVRLLASHAIGNP